MPCLNQPCLNQEILFDIGKKLVEDGDQDVVYEFALSGKETFEAMNIVFASVTTVELYGDYYTIGWGNKGTTFEFRSDEPHSRFLMRRIGHCVRELHVNKKMMSFYQPIIDNIISRRQLVSFSAGPDCALSFLDKFLPLMSSSLKNVKIPSYKMTKVFRDSLNLDSLIISDAESCCFGLFCCKTVSLECSALLNIVDLGCRISPYLTSIKHLTYNDTRRYLNISIVENLMLYFPSLESLKINIILAEDFSAYLIDSVPYFVDALEKARIFPSKITCSFCKSNEKMVFPYLYKCIRMCESFEYDGVKNPEFYCFRKMIQSEANEEATLFEVQFFK